MGDVAHMWVTDVVYGHFLVSDAELGLTLDLAGEGVGMMDGAGD